MLTVPGTLVKQKVQQKVRLDNPSSEIFWHNILCFMSLFSKICRHSREDGNPCALQARKILRPEMVVTVKLRSAAVYRVLRGVR